MDTSGGVLAAEGPFAAVRLADVKYALVCTNPELRDLVEHKLDGEGMVLDESAKVQIEVWKQHSGRTEDYLDCLVFARGEQVAEFATESKTKGSLNVDPDLVDELVEKLRPLASRLAES